MRFRFKSGTVFDSPGSTNYLVNRILRQWVLRAKLNKNKICTRLQLGPPVFKEQIDIFGKTVELQARSFAIRFSCLVIRRRMLDAPNS